jgi:hypothetical protein
VLAEPAPAASDVAASVETPAARDETATQTAAQEDLPTPPVEDR